MTLLKSAIRAAVLTPVRRLRKRARRAQRQRDERTLLQYAPLAVLRGPFAGMRLQGACSPIGPKVLGTHELELAPVIERLCRSDVRHIVNVGAADGFYAVGLLRHLGTARAIAFELLAPLHASMRTLAASNGVAERLDIRGACDRDALSAVLGDGTRTLVIMDVEGAERDLLDPGHNAALRRAQILVELHDFVDPAISRTIRSRFVQTHAVTVYRSRKRTQADLPPIAGVDGATLLRLADEGRPTEMEWFWLEPHVGS